MEPQRFILFLCQLKAEIFGETLRVAVGGFVQIFRFHLIEPRQVSVQHDLDTSDGIHQFPDAACIYRHDGCLFCGLLAHTMSFPLEIPNWNLKFLILPLGKVVEYLVKFLIGVDAQHLLADEEVCHVQSEEMLLPIGGVLLAD